MALHEPSWIRKTKPCPFYSQGRCLFADSCNFLHSARIRSADSDSIIDTSRELVNHSFQRHDQWSDSSRANTPADPPPTPAVSVLSPQSTRSRRHSPRLSGLLFALRSVIGPDEEEVDDDEEEEVNIEEASIRMSVNTEEDPFDIIPPAPSPLSCQTDKTLLTPISPVEASFLTGSTSTSGISFLSDFPQPPSSLPFVFRHATSTPPSRSNSTASKGRTPKHISINVREDSFDSGFADGRMSPHLLPSSPPVTAGLNSTFDLLASPFSPPQSRLLSPRGSVIGMPSSPVFGGFMNAVAYTAQSSPIRSKRRSRQSLDSDLDSPTDRRRDREEEDRQLNGLHLNELAISSTSDFSSVSSLSSASSHRAIPLLPPADADLTITAMTEYDGSFIASGISPNDCQPLLGPSLTRSSSSNSPRLPVDVLYSTDDNDELDNSIPSSPQSLPAGSPTLTLGVPLFRNDATLSFTSPRGNHSSNSGVTDINFSGTSVTLVDPEFSLPREDANSCPTDSDITDSKRKLKDSLRLYLPQATCPSPNGTDDRSSMAPSVSDIDDSGSSSSRKVPFGFRHSLVNAQAKPPPLMKRHSVRGKSISRRSRLVDSTDLHLSRIPNTTHDETTKPSWMKPLRLSRTSSPTFPDSQSSLSTCSHAYLDSVHVAHSTTSTPSVSPFSPSISSDYSLAQNPLVFSVTFPHNKPSDQELIQLSLNTSSLIPENIRRKLIQTDDMSPLCLAYDANSFMPLQSPHSTNSVQSIESRSQKESRRTPFGSFGRLIDSPGLLSSISEPLFGPATGEDDTGDDDTYRFNRFYEASQGPQSAPLTRASTSLRSPTYLAIAQPPMLMFAIASDDVSQVRRALESGTAHPNDQIGPQTALAFVLTNDALENKLEIAKVLLAYGADPTFAKVENGHRRWEDEAKGLDASPCEDALDPAIEYYLSRAGASHTRQASNLIHGSFFRPLVRMPFEVIGQDRALEQLYRVLRMHSQQTEISPLVVLCCGPSGHGKSLLARRFGHLLDIPTHTVNMTTLQSGHDLWQSRSMSPYEEPSSRTLSEFLADNEGKRCVVVLDDMDKTEDERHLWALMAPWELGRCSVEAGRRHVDVRNVVWIGTSNVGQEVVFKHHGKRADPDELMTRAEYIELMALIRPHVSAHFGASLLSRVTCVLPFVPFTTVEKRAIASENITVSSSRVRSEEQDSPIDKEVIIARALSEYLPVEGARSLHRSVSTQLLDVL